VDQRVKAFLEDNHVAVMTTLKDDGMPHVARVGVGLVEGRLWSSGTLERVRTRHLRRDNRSTLCILSNDRWRWLGLESRVSILEGPEAPEQNLALYRVIRRASPEDIDEYLQAMVAEKRIIYEFEILRAYGRY
jgi:PPOX class probable F420-dependent enzyme